MSLRLFAVKDRTNGKVVGNEYYESKMEAKEARDKLNPERDKDFQQGTLERYYVVKGPDHKLYGK